MKKRPVVKTVRHTLQHSGEKQFQCNYCDIAFLRKEHREETISMYIWDKAFFKKSDLVRHTLQHSGEKPFQCNYCDKVF